LFSSPNHPPGNLDECQHLLYPYHRSCQFRYRNTIAGIRDSRYKCHGHLVFSKIIFIDFIDAIRIMIFGKTIMLLMLGYKKSLKLSYTFTIPVPGSVIFTENGANSIE
jgi:hypothetical protein